MFLFKPRASCTYCRWRRSNGRTWWLPCASATPPRVRRWRWAKWCPWWWRTAWWPTPEAAAEGCRSGLVRGWSDIAAPGPPWAHLQEVKGHKPVRATLTVSFRTGEESRWQAGFKRFGGEDERRWRRELIILRCRAFSLQREDEIIDPEQVIEAKTKICCNIISGIESRVLQQISTYPADSLLLPS